MAFDYCTPSEAFEYGASAGTSVDPVNELTVMARIVTAVSRTIDERCDLAFSRETYTNQRLYGRLTEHGVLSVALPTVEVSNVTALAARQSPLDTWRTLDVGTVDLDNRTYGATLFADATILLSSRRIGRPLQIQISYTAGYASAASMPADLRWAAQAAAWYEFQRRSAPQDTTAMPAMGVVIIPKDWPPHILNRLKPYTRWNAS